MIESLIQNFPSDFCLICGGRPAVIGIFSPAPEDAESWGAVRGGSRIFRYCLCESCRKEPDAQEQVEKVIFAQIVSGGNYASK